MNYNESDEIKSYIWLNYNEIIPTEYYIYKKERALSKGNEIGNDGIKPQIKYPCNNSRLVQLAELLAGIDDGELDEYMEQLVKLGKWGPLVINRCKKCGNVLKTKDSKQCLWCNSDWH